MEGLSPRSELFRQKCESNWDFNLLNDSDKAPNLPTAHKLDNLCLSWPGNEENAPENSNEDCNCQQQQQPHESQQQVIKRMRIGGASYQRQNSGSRRFSGSDVSSSIFTRNQDDNSITRTHQSKQSVENQSGHVSWDAMSDNPANSPSNCGGHQNTTSAKNMLHGVPPTLQMAHSSDSASSSVSSNSRKYLDAFGKQNKGDVGTQDNHNHNSFSSNGVHRPDKDPRFHSKRKSHRPSIESMISAENAPTGGVPLFPEDAMEDPRVFLAPVIVPPSVAASRGSASPWKVVPKETAQGFASPVQHQRSGIAKTSHDAIAAAQDAPELAASSSQETSSSVAMSTMTTSTTSSMASALVKRLVDSKSAVPNTRDSTKARLQHRQAVIRGTPVRIKPRPRYSDVQATDQGYASVAKLSAWLADDPTSTKKVRHVRRGANVIAKSRQFEKDLEHIIVEENNIATGAVKEKKNWLKSVFSHDASDGIDEDRSHHDDFAHHDPNRHMMMMRTKPVTFADDCARSEFVVSNDAASSISVTNKKKWLESAFKKEGGNSVVGQRRTSYKTQSDIGPVRENRDDITSRAKMMWAAKSEKRNAEGSTNAYKPPVAASSPYRTNQRPPALRDGTPRKNLEDRLRATTRVSAPSPAMAKAARATTTTVANQQPARHSIAVCQVEEDNTPVDFRAARELLIQRSKENGNEVKIASKVQKRADKFEKIIKDVKRRSSATGLLKPTWESNSVAGSEVSDCPSDAYTKSFVENIAPKRSFDELP